MSVPRPVAARWVCNRREVRTLVISDLHLGSRLRRDVLHHPAALEALLDALDGVERLVLLGDIVELLGGQAVEAMAAAEPVLRAVGARLGSGREAILVPGNHDAALVRSWARAQGVSLAVDARVPVDATPLLARVTSWLAPASVRVTTRASGSRSGCGRPTATISIVTCCRRSPTASPAGCSVACRVTAPRRPTTNRPGDLRSHGLRPCSPTVCRARSPCCGTTWSSSSAPRRCRASRGACSHTASRPSPRCCSERRRDARVFPRSGASSIGSVSDAEWVIFGHVHRCGPLAGDDPRRWRGPGGRPQLANTGSWVHEPLLLHRASPPHPYWPGGAILLQEGRNPKAIGLLDQVDAVVLH